MMNRKNDNVKNIWIYHELQESQLCGQHCLNNLLQGNYFSPPDLASIAQELDITERQHMLEGGVNNPDLLRFLAEGSGNVDDSGNFSLQVLSTALIRSHNIKLVNWSSREASDTIQDPTIENGFIVNKADHWFAIRKIGGKWWNLNSTNDAPELVTDFYLSAFLSQLRSDGYSVFIAVGNLPVGDKESPLLLQSTGNWHLLSNLIPNSNEASNTKFSGKGHRLGGTVESENIENPIDFTNEDEMLAAAIKLSQQEFEENENKKLGNPPKTKKEIERELRLAALEKRTK